MNIEEAQKILELISTATQEDIRRAYLKMAKQYHPDLYQTFSQQAWATRRFIKIKEAYDLLMSYHEYHTVQDTVIFSKNIYYDEEQSVSHSRFALFALIFNKIPRDAWDKPFTSIRNLIGCILELILIPLLLVFLPYGIILMILQDILEKFNIKAFLDSRSKKERFAFLMISTLAALLYLPIFYYMAFTRSGQTPPTMLRIVLGIAFSTMVISFVLSEWISFFLTIIWSRSIQHELDKFLPIKIQK